MLREASISVADSAVMVLVGALPVSIRVGTLGVIPVDAGQRADPPATIDYRVMEPPYLQLAAILRGRIASGDLPPGQMVPSIVTLSQEYRLAKTTARKALDILKNEGLIVTRPSWGTFVAEQPR